MDDMRYAAIGGRLTLCTYQFKGACNHLTVSNQLMFLNFPTIELNPIQYLSSTDYKPSTVVDVIMQERVPCMLRGCSKGIRWNAIRTTHQELS